MEVLWTHFTNDTSAVCFYGSDLHCCINGKQSCRATTTVRLFIRPSSTTLLESHIVTTNICENRQIDQFDQRPWIQFEGSEGRRCWNEVAVRATHSIALYLIQSWHYCWFSFYYSSNNPINRGFSNIRGCGNHWILPIEVKELTFTCISCLWSFLQQQTFFSCSSRTRHSAHEQPLYIKPLSYIASPYLLTYALHAWTSIREVLISILSFAAVA